MSDPAIPRRSRIAAAILIGLALLAVTAVWWFFYYSQYNGSFNELALKTPCLATMTDECLAMQKQLAGSMIPAYQPVLFWAGAAILGLGIVQQLSRRG
jgi:hypothetical protein